MKSTGKRTNAEETFRAYLRRYGWQKSSCIPRPKTGQCPGKQEQPSGVQSQSLEYTGPHQENERKQVVETAGWACRGSHHAHGVKDAARNRQWETPLYCRLACQCMAETEPACGHSLAQRSGGQLTKWPGFGGSSMNIHGANKQGQRSSDLG